MDWKVVPYSHKYPKAFTSIFNPQSKITFPQFVAEMVIFNRARFIKDFPKIEKGPGWSKQISKVVRGLVQQATVVCNYFPDINEDPLVEEAFKNFFRNNRVFKIGQYRKVRVTKAGKLNITQDEKDIINGIDAEYKKLVKKRQIFREVRTVDEPQKTKIVSKYSSKSKGVLDDILEMEKSLERIEDGN